MVRLKGWGSEMNLLRECTFFDRFRNSFIEIDDLIEEAYLDGSVSMMTSTKVVEKDESLPQPPTEDGAFSFYLLLYFTADWLPENSNQMLNEKLKKFYERKKSKANFELIFISSDKTNDSYTDFLNKNRFIRYSLAFHEKDLKV